MTNKTITDPSGNKFTISIPDGQNPPESDLFEFVQQEISAGRLKPDAPEPGFFSAENWTPEGSVGDIYETFTGGVQDAATFGLADKARDVGRVAGQYLTPESLGGEAGWGMTALQKAIMDQWGSSAKERALREARNPKTALAGNVAGWMANPPVSQATRWAMGQKAGSGLAEPGLTGLRRIYKDAHRLRTGPAITPQSKKLTAAKLAGVGAGTGGLYGLGKEGTLEAGAEHAALGAGLSLAGSGLVNVGGWGLKKLNDYFLKNAGQRQTAVDMRLLGQALEADGWTIQTASKELERLGPRAVLADLGDATARLTFKAYTKSPKEIRRGFQERQQGVGEPGFKTGGQAQTIDEQLGKISPKSLRETRKDLSKTRADKLYEEAFKANPQMDSPEINRILSHPDVEGLTPLVAKYLRSDKAAISRYDKELTAQHLAEGGEGKVGKGMTMRALDMLKKLLYDKEQGAKRVVAGVEKETQQSGSYSRLRRDLIREMDALDVTAQAGPGSMKAEGGAYARGRAIEGERLQGMDMAEMGRKFKVGGNLEDMRELLADATQEQVDAFRSGYVDKLRESVGSTKRWIDVTKKIQGSELEDKKLKLLFDSPEAFKKYMATLEAEGKMYGTGARVMQGSKTAEMTEAVKQGEVDAGRMLQSFMDIKRGISTLDPAATLRGATGMGRGLYDHTTMTSAQADRLAKLLMGRDLSGLEQVYTPMVQDRNLQNRLARLLMQGGYQPGREIYLGR